MMTVSVTYGNSVTALTLHSRIRKELSLAPAAASRLQAFALRLIPYQATAELGAERLRRVAQAGSLASP